MYDKLSSISKSSIYQSLTQSTTPAAIFNTSQKTVIVGRQSKIQRWILGMIIGSAPFLAIIVCWIFLSVCINNLVRFYQQQKHRYRPEARTNGTRNTVPKTNV